MDDARARLPEAHAVLGTSGGQEVVHLGVGGQRVLQVSHATEAATPVVEQVKGGGWGGHKQWSELKEGVHGNCAAQAQALRALLLPRPHATPALSAPCWLSS